MFDIITFGSATRDIFLKTKHFWVGDFNLKNPGKEICLPHGFKIDIEEVHFHSGGGGTNVAATFVRQGFKTAYCGMIGSDCDGGQVLQDLQAKGIDCSFVARTTKKPTDLSIIFSTPQERTILVYRGASTEWRKEDIPWPKIKEAKWFYLAPFVKGTEKLFGEILNFAQKNKIKTMVNPGSAFLNLPLRETKRFLEKIDILLLNQEEAQTLMKNRGLYGQELVLKIKKEFPGILVITNGHQRAFLSQKVSQKDKIYSVLPFNAKTVDKTGAGDAFGSGFLSGYLQSKGNMVYSLQLALANSIACFSQWGAKEGLLKKDQPFKKAKVNAISKKIA